MSQSNEENPPEPQEIHERDYTKEEVDDIEQQKADWYLDMMGL
jgi:hypothetical protein